MKKFFSIFLVAILSLGLSTTAFAQTRDISSYEEVLNSINKEFQLNLGYIPVDESKTTIEEYTRITREVATQQKNLLDYIAMRQIQTKTDILAESISPLATVTKTITNDVWGYSSYFSITATYNVNGNQVSSMRSAKFNYKLMASLSNTYVVGLSAPSYSIIDGGRTGTVSFIGDLHYNSAIGYKNTTFYSEFYYSS